LLNHLIMTCPDILDYFYIFSYLVIDIYQILNRRNTLKIQMLELTL